MGWLPLYVGWCVVWSSTPRAFSGCFLSNPIPAKLMPSRWTRITWILDTNHLCCLCLLPHWQVCFYGIYQVSRCCWHWLPTIQTATPYSRLITAGEQSRGRRRIRQGISLGEVGFGDGIRFKKTSSSHSARYFLFLDRAVRSSRGKRIEWHLADLHGKTHLSTTKFL
jgi:hypothetical protein